MAKKSTTALPAKLIPPTGGVATERTRLIESIAHRYEQQRALWLSAPGGSGKTTLAVSYLQQSGRKPLWYQIDERDNDPAHFFQYLARGIKAQAPRRKFPLPPLTQEYQADLSTFARRYFELLAQRLDQNGIVVFDNSQLLDDEGPLMQLLPLLLDALLPGQSLLLISRHQPPAPFMPPLAAQQLTILNWDELRFSRQEWGEVAALFGLTDSSGAMVEELHRLSDGWISALVLGGQNLEASRNSAVEALKSHSFDYFAAEYFNSLQHDERRLLLSLAFMPATTAQEAGDLASNSAAPKLLNQMVRNNRFVARQGVHYLFHPLFLQFLQERAREELPDRELHTLRERSATLLSETDHPLEAARLWQQIGRQDKLVTLTLGRAAELYNGGKLETLAQLLSLVPAETAQEQPWISYWRGALLSLLDLAGGIEQLEIAFTQFRSQRCAEGAYLCLLTVLRSINATWRETRALPLWLKRYDQLQAEQLELPDTIAWEQIVSQLAQGYLFSYHDQTELNRWAEQLDIAIRRCSDASLMQELLGAGLFLTFVLGQGNKGRYYRELLLQQQESPEQPPLQRLNAMVNRILGDYFVGACDEAVAQAEQALDYAEQNALHIMDGVICVSAYMASVAAGDHAAARRFMEGMAEQQSLFNLVKANHLYARTTFALIEGRYSDAQFSAEELLSVGEDIGIPMYVLMAAMLRAETAVLSEPHQPRTRDLLQKAQRLADTMAVPAQQIKARFLAAVRETDHDRRIELLGQGWRMVREQGHCLFSGWLSWLFSRATHEALRHGIEYDTAFSYATSFRAVLSPPERTVTRWPWPIRITTLGCYEVSVDGGPCQGGQRDSRPLQLLKLLSALGGRVAVSRLIEAFYGVERNAKSQQQLHNHLYRLRKLLQHDEAIRLSGEWVELNPAICWVDADALQSANRAELSPHERNTLILLYQGEFLPDMQEWEEVTIRREQLRTRYLELVSEQLQLAPLSHDEARELCQTAISVEPLAEPLYRYLIELHLNLGRLDLAQLVFEQCQRLLRTHLDCEPSPQTAALLK